MHYTRAGDDGLQIEFKPVERKITSRHGVDSRALSEQLRHAWGPAARVWSFHEDSLERNFRLTFVLFLTRIFACSYASSGGRRSDYSRANRSKLLLE